MKPWGAITQGHEGHLHQAIDTLSGALGTICMRLWAVIYTRPWGPFS